MQSVLRRAMARARVVLGYCHVTWATQILDAAGRRAAFGPFDADEDAPRVQARQFSTRGAIARLLDGCPP